MSSAFLNHMLQQRNPGRIIIPDMVATPDISTLPVNAFATTLFTFRLLKGVALQLLERERKAPGPDRIVLKDLTGSEINQICAAIVNVILQGDYQATPGRDVEIPKRRESRRTITIQNAIDALIARQLLLFLTQHFDSLFSPKSFGGRPGKSIHQLLSRFSKDLMAPGQFLFFEVDIKEAFNHVKIDLLFSFIDRLGLHQSMTRLVKIVALAGREYTAGMSGIPQGNPLSMFLLNLYLHHLIDGKIESSGPCYRYVDNIIYLAPTKSEGRRLLVELSEVLESGGMEFKEPQYVDLRRQSATLFNLELNLQDRRPRFELTEECWEKLIELLRDCYEERIPANAARQLITSILRIFRLCLSDKQFPQHHMKLLEAISHAELQDEVNVDDFTLLYGELAVLWQAEVETESRVVTESTQATELSGASHHTGFDTLVQYCLVSRRHCTTNVRLRLRPRRGRAWKCMSASIHPIRGPPVCRKDFLNCF